jgi:hypothetical protein
MKGYSIFNSELHGCGVQADTSFATDESVLLEQPFHFLQSLPNRKSVVVCTACLKPLGSLQVQAAVLQGLVSRQNFMEESGNFSLLPYECPCCPAVPCLSNCGELYCSNECRDHHWSYKGHKYLCTGAIPDEEAEYHPLIGFKMHAMTTNEIFLMVGDVFASICCHVDGLVASGTSIEQAFDVAMKPLAGYVRELWWDAAITPKGYKPAAFKKSLKTLVKDSWDLLNEVLQLESRGYASFLNAEYLSRLFL